MLASAAHGLHEGLLHIRGAAAIACSGKHYANVAQMLSLRCWLLLHNKMLRYSAKFTVAPLSAALLTVSYCTVWSDLISIAVRQLRRRTVCTSKFIEFRSFRAREGFQGALPMER